MHIVCVINAYISMISYLTSQERDPLDVCLLFKCRKCWAKNDMKRISNTSKILKCTNYFSIKDKLVACWPFGPHLLASGLTYKRTLHSDIQTHTIFGHTNSHIRTYKLTHSDIQTHTPIVAPHGLLWARGGR